MNQYPNLINIAPAPNSSSSVDKHLDLDFFHPPPRKNISNACTACRRRRSRCNGTQPCNACTSHGTECIKDEKDDRRRKIAINKRIGELELNNFLLDDLLAAIRNTDLHQLNTLVSLIRGHVSKEELRSHLTNSFTAVSPHRRVTCRIQDMINPIITVPAKPWTTVTDDDDYISHLMSLWFTWAHPWWQWIDKEVLIEAMCAGNISSPVCTPFLVNMILADACTLDTISEDTNEPNKWLREQFYNEARRGIEAENGKVSYALVATLGVQWSYLNTNGKDKLGNPILYQQIYLANGLEKWRSRIGSAPEITPKMLVDIDKSLDRLLWTLFALNSMTMINLEQSQPLRPPKRPKPRIDHHMFDAGKTWSPYPELRQPIGFHSECHYHAFLSLAEKATRDEAAFHSNGGRLSRMNRFKEIYQQLEDWPHTLPDCLKRQTRTMPHIMALHALHHWIMVILTKQLAALEAGHPDKPTILSTPQSDEGAYWQNTCVRASIEISKILGQSRAEWGTDHFPVIIMWPLSIAPFALLEVLDQRPDAQRALVELCIGIYAASRRFHVGRGILGALQKAAHDRGVVLPPECRELIEAVTRSVSGDKLDRQGNLPSEGVEWLLEKWHDLDLD